MVSRQEVMHQGLKVQAIHCITDRLRCRCSMFGKNMALRFQGFLNQSDCPFNTPNLPYQLHQNRNPPLFVTSSKESIRYVLLRYRKSQDEQNRVPICLILILLRHGYNTIANLTGATVFCLTVFPELMIVEHQKYSAVALRWRKAPQLRSRRTPCKPGIAFYFSNRYFPMATTQHMLSFSNILRGAVLEAAWSPC